jgi:hypothetical protein
MEKDGAFWEASSFFVRAGSEGWQAPPEICRKQNPNTTTKLPYKSQI